MFPTDAAEWVDTDYDGFGDNSDECPTSYGNSSIDRYGCSDLDGDGMSDLTDAFVADTTQTTDSDNDGYGDNLTGFRGDACPNTTVNQTATEHTDVLIMILMVGRFRRCFSIRFQPVVRLGWRRIWRRINGYGRCMSRPVW